TPRRRAGDRARRRPGPRAAAARVPRAGRARAAARASRAGGGMSRLATLARIFGGRRDGASSGLVRLRDALRVLQAAIAVAAVTLAQSASVWAVALTVALAVIALLRPLPPEPAGRPIQRLWTVGIVAALAASGARFLLLGVELLVAGVDLLLLMIVQRL